MGPEPEGADPRARAEALAQRISDFMPALSPTVRAGVRLAIRVFPWLGFPRRLSARSAAGRERFERFLVRMETSPAPPRRDLLLLAKLLFNLSYSELPETRAAIGATMSCAVKPDGAGQATANEPGAAAPDGLAGANGLGDLTPPAEGEQCDVVIVGSGAGGAAAASVLAEAGLDVLVLEAGGAHRHRHDEEEIMPSLARLYRDGGLTVALGRPALPIPVGRTVGGTTVINSGTCFRAPESILRDWRERSGIEWATGLERHFADAEKFLRVRQLEAEDMGRNGQLAMLGAERLSYSGAPISRNADRCAQCSGCPLGCPIDAKRSMRVSYLPRAVAAGARLRAGVEARRLIFEGERCVGVECVARPAGHEHELDAPGRPFTVRAERVVLAGGAFGTPELLMRSGLGGPAVGRQLRAHPATWVGARYPEPVRGWQGVMQSYYVDEWKDRGLLLEATFTPLPFGGAWLPGAGRDFQRALHAYDHVGSIGVHLADRGSVGRVRLNNHGVSLSYRLTRAEAETIAFGIARAAEIHFAAGASEVYPNIAGMPRLTPGDLPHLDPSRVKPAYLRLEAFHPLGTARIDPDPRRGVTAPDGAVHGTAGLYVADASLFPSAVGVNPMITIIAFAQRVAEQMLEAM